MRVTDFKIRLVDVAIAIAVRRSGNAARVAIRERCECQSCPSSIPLEFGGQVECIAGTLLFDDTHDACRSAKLSVQLRLRQVRRRDCIDRESQKFDAFCPNFRPPGSNPAHPDRLRSADHTTLMTQLRRFTGMSVQRAGCY